jgi:hypothetical protein
MIAVVIGTAPVHPWAAAVAVDTHLRLTTITMTVAAPRVATAPDATTTADALHRASSTIDVKEDMDDPHRVVAWEGLMSMVHRARATLTILTMPGPDHLLVATTTRTSTAAVMAAHMRQGARHRRVVPVPAVREVAHHMTPRLSTHLVAISNAPFPPRAAAAPTLCALRASPTPNFGPR